MLETKTYLDKSNINGIGLFAGENIAQGSRIWSYHPSIDFSFSPVEWEHLQKSISKACFHQIRKYAYKEKNRFILCADNAQFMNHSDSFYNVGNVKKGDIMIALTDIQQGEELVCNYFEYCDPDDANLTEIS